VIAVDATVVAVALADDGPDGDHARARLRGERLAAPELAGLEVTSLWRRQVRDASKYCAQHAEPPPSRSRFCGAWCPRLML
jgi:hypothetical protein